MTHGEWREYFESLPNEKREELLQALTTLESDPQFKKEWDWTGLFGLSIDLRFLIEGGVKRW